MVKSYSREHKISSRRKNLEKRATQFLIISRKMEVLRHSGDPENSIHFSHE